ncbi:flippase activity-associated protein Agl23 [Halobaculum sp. P14]|uniref:flippase activity-associated protein Agl23 n=1 Tax=Halobaculum sp. P14 TaxID=3421638 RepID=UPI003EB6EDF6
MSRGDEADAGSTGRLGRVDRVVVAVAVIALAALAARLLFLGARPFHWGEGRVGYWTLRFLETGAWEYRPVAGGPFLYVVGRWWLSVAPPTDAAARVPVAVVGGLLPLAALLFRGTLRDDETVALAGVLAADPLLVYYSRFLRGDVPAAAFGLVAVGGVVRFRDTGSRPALYLAAASFALALSASGFAVAYPFVWLAAALLVVDEARVRGAPREALSTVGAAGGWLVDRVTPLARSLFVFLAVVVVFFAPRAAAGGVGLNRPATIPTAVVRALVASPKKFAQVHVAFRLDPGAPAGPAFIPVVAGYASTLVHTAWPMLVAALVGFALERYRRDTRSVVAFGGYAAGVGLLVFPLSSMRAEPWTAVHVLPWLALPAAVGVARLARGVRGYVARGLTGADTSVNPARVVAALLVVSAVGAGVGTAVAGAYAPAQPGSPFAQFAQPSDDLDPMLDAAEPVIAANVDGADVAYVGDRFDTEREYAQPPIPTRDQKAWGARLPLQWYFERADADVTSVPSVTFIPGDAPPVVVTTPERRVAVHEALPEYRQFDLHLGLWDRKVVVFVAPQ